MRRALTLFFAVFVICALFTPVVSAHSPAFPGNNTSLNSAYVVSDPTKSWALYTTLQPGQVQYYRFEISQGQSIYVQLYKNTLASNLGFVPSFVLMGPGLTSNGTAAANVAVPPGSSSIVMQGQQPDQGAYEGFGPGSFYDLGSVEVKAPATGTYYVAVYDAANGGAYGLAIGERETYTPTEYLLIPYSVFQVHLWEGQNPLVVLAPLILVVIVGLGILVMRRDATRTPRCGRPSPDSARWLASSSSEPARTTSHRCSLPSLVPPSKQRRSSRSYSCSCPSS